MDSLVKIDRALISVSDKKELKSLVQSLNNWGVEILSTGGTGEKIKEWGIPFTPIEEVTGNPEAFGGRMKTLSFQIESGLLYRRGHEVDEREARELNIPKIDLVVCNLYPFQAKKDSGVQGDELVEFIDIGGPTMIRSAAKNHAHVGVCVDPADYADLIKEIDAYDGHTTKDFRKKLAMKAFNHTADYDVSIAKDFQEQLESADGPFFLSSPKLLDLRYGENPHQSATLYSFGKTSYGLANAKILQGKPLSYNNLLDADAAWKSAYDTLLSINAAGKLKTPNVVSIIKHLNPCGLAAAETPLYALEKAWAGDPVSAFGSIICFTQEMTADCAQWLSDKFIEIVIAPSISADTLNILKKKKNLRVLLCPPKKSLEGELKLQSISGGLLVQQEDEGLDSELECVTKSPFPEEKVALSYFGLMACKHLKSNAIALVGKDGEAFSLIGAGMGQPNRVDSLKRLAIPRAEEKGAKIEDLVFISDAFLPFADNIYEAHKVGLKYIVQPGGSIRDNEVIAACDELGMSMLFTGRRHFRH